MTYYTNLFSPETYEAFTRSSRDTSGFKETQIAFAERVQPGDRFVCYMTKLSRWIGILEIAEPYRIERTPLFYADDDPFVVRFEVKSLIWLAKERTLPIHEPQVWDSLTFTRDNDPATSAWTGPVRRSLNVTDRQDGELLESLLRRQAGDSPETPALEFPVDEDRFRRLVTQRVRRADRTVTVTVPANDDDQESSDRRTASDEPPEVRESSRMQAMLARVGEEMGFKIWLPRNDRSTVLREWEARADSLLPMLPLNYDETTLQTIEMIDVLWLRGRSIVRAFEVEHTTAVYSGILRMADLLALQPNMDIRLHIVAPDARRDKVMTEIQRPVFSLLERAPLAECCTFISYDSLVDLAEQRNLRYLSDAVLEQYEEKAE